MPADVVVVDGGMRGHAADAAAVVGGGGAQAEAAHRREGQRPRAGVHVDRRLWKWKKGLRKCFALIQRWSIDKACPRLFEPAPWPPLAVLLRGSPHLFGTTLYNYFIKVISVSESHPIRSAPLSHAIGGLCHIFYTSSPSVATSVVTSFVRTVVRSLSLFSA